MVVCRDRSRRVGRGPNNRRPPRGLEGIAMKITRIVLFGLVVLLPAASRADAPALPEDVRAALEKNARSLADLTVAGSRSRRLLAPAATAFAALGVRESEAEFTQRIRFELRLQGAKIREAIRYPAGQYNSGNGVNERSY